MKSTTLETVQTKAQLIERVGVFVRDEVAPRAAEIDRSGEYPYDLMERCAELGLTGILFPEQYGGSDLGLATFCEVLELISTECQTLAITLDASMTLCFLPILMLGTDEQKNRYLPRAARGEIIGAIAGTEETGAFNFPAYSSKAVEVDAGWSISGRKIYITNSQAADVYVLLALADGGGTPTAFIVEKDDDGLSFGELEEKLGWNGNNSGTVVAEAVQVGPNRVLGGLHDGSNVLIAGISMSMVGIGAMCVGAAAGAAKLTLERVTERNLLGRPLIDAQGVYDTIGRMAIDIEASRALVQRTAALIDEGQLPTPGTRASLLASACKVEPPEMAARVCDQAIQLHGGHGYMTSAVHRYWRDVRACQIGEGPTYFHLQVAAEYVKQVRSF